MENKELNLDAYGPKEFSDEQKEQQFIQWYKNPNRKGLLNVEAEIRSQGLSISEVYFNRIYGSLKDIFMTFVGRISRQNNGMKKFNNTNITFQLFGVDVGVNDKLNPIVMEINKGPDLGAKDTRDSNLKHNVVRDMLQILGITKTFKPHNFIKILDVKDKSVNIDSKHI